MSKVIKIIFLFIIILVTSVNICFAIDESELYANNTNNVSSNIANTANTTNDLSANVENTETTNQASENTIVNEQIQSDSVEATDTRSITPVSDEDPSSTTVSGVSSISDGSAFATILDIALIVIGILLVLLAIAILIRLKS